MRLTRVRGVPLTGEARGFTETVRRQLLCNSVAKADRMLSVLTSPSCSGEVGPHVRLHRVLAVSARCTRLQADVARSRPHVRTTTAGVPVFVERRRRE
jgi:hypothetical protein